MYGNSCWQYFYTGLALIIFAGWWFVWSLHILSIIYGRLRLYRSSQKRYEYGIGGANVGSARNGRYYQSIPSPTLVVRGAGHHDRVIHSSTVVQVDQLISSSRDSLSRDGPAGSSPDSYVVISIPPATTSHLHTPPTVTSRHHHSRSYSTGTGLIGGGLVSRGTSSSTSLPVVPGGHVTTNDKVVNGGGHVGIVGSSHYRSLSGGSSRTTVQNFKSYHPGGANGMVSAELSSTATSTFTISPTLSSSSTFSPSSSSSTLSNHPDYSHPSETVGNYYKSAPGVTIIKPLMGIDPNIYQNLETFFLLDYHKFEICFCIQDYQDSCIMLVKRLMDKYPGVDATLYLGGPEIVINSKINNMLPAYNSAKYELILISDAGIKMLPHSLTDMVNTMTTGVGLVHQMPFTTDRSGFPGTLEKVYFGTAHARIYLVSDLLRINCCTGMSSLMRKSVLDSKGGLASFGCYLAEDYFFAQAFRDMGWRHRISTQPALQNAGDPCVKSFHERIIRWTKLRFAMVPVTIFFEPLSECLLLGLITSWAVYWLFEWNSLVFFMVHCLVWFLLDFTLLRIVQHGKLPFNRLDYFVAWVYRELSALPLFLIALNTSVLRWKNKTYRLRWGGYVEKTSSVDSLVY